MFDTGSSALPAAAITSHETSSIQIRSVVAAWARRLAGRGQVVCAEMDGTRLGAHLTIAYSEKHAANTQIATAVVGLSRPGARVVAYAIAASANAVGNIDFFGTPTAYHYPTRPISNRLKSLRPVAAGRERSDAEPAPPAARPACVCRYLAAWGGPFAPAS